MEIIPSRRVSRAPDVKKMASRINVFQCTYIFTVVYTYVHLQVIYQQGTTLKTSSQSRAHGSVYTGHYIGFTLTGHILNTR